MSLVQPSGVYPHHTPDLQMLKSFGELRVHLFATKYHFSVLLLPQQHLGSGSNAGSSGLNGGRF